MRGQTSTVRLELLLHVFIHCFSPPSNSPPRPVKSRLTPHSTMSSSSQSAKELQAQHLRKRASSVSQVVDDVSSPSTGQTEVPSAVAPGTGSANKQSKQSSSSTSSVGSQGTGGSAGGLLRDIYTMRWMTSPASSAKLASIFLIGYANWRIFTPNTPNPFEPFLFLSHRVPTAEVLLMEPSTVFSGDTVRYQKGWYDLAFLSFYVVVFSFLRQASLLYIFKPFAVWWGIKNPVKQERLMEQGYAMLYWGTFGAIGIVSAVQRRKAQILSYPLLTLSSYFLP